LCEKQIKIQPPKFHNTELSYGFRRFG